jgi:hypothetical protein
VSDIDTVVVDSLKVLDPKRPIREADMPTAPANVRFRGKSGHWSALALNPSVVNDPQPT